MADLGTLTTTVSLTGNINSSFNQTMDVPYQRVTNESAYMALLSSAGAVVSLSNIALHVQTTNFIFPPISQIPLPIGRGKISGVVKVEGILLAYEMVRIIHKETGFICAVLRSDENGYFETFCVPLNVEFYAIAHLQDYNAVVIDSLFAVPM